MRWTYIAPDRMTQQCVLCWEISHKKLVVSVDLSSFFYYCYKQINSEIYFMKEYHF